MAVYVGRVVAGMGSFGFWIDKLHDHYLRKTDMHLYPGTLNVRFDQPYSLPKEVIRLEAHEYGGAVSVSMVPCLIEGRKAFVLRTDLNEQGRGHHPKTIVEIAAEVRLRDALELKDGDEVKIEILDRFAPGGLDSFQ